MTHLPSMLNPSVWLIIYWLYFWIVNRDRERLKQSQPRILSDASWRLRL